MNTFKPGQLLESHAGNIFLIVHACNDSYNFKLILLGHSGILKINKYKRINSEPIFKGLTGSYIKTMNLV